MAKMSLRELKYFYRRVLRMTGSKAEAHNALAFIMRIEREK